MIRILTLSIVVGCAGWPVSARQQAAPGSSRVSSVTKAQLDEWMVKYSNWGRWGKDDQLGTLHLITPAKRLEAAQLVRTGLVVSMAKPIVARDVNPEDPSKVTNRGGVESAYMFQGEYVRERQEMEFHGAVMTHYDALCHVSYAGKFYNDINRADAATEKSGCSKMDGSTVRDGVISRGLFLDMPGVHVTPREIEAWERKTGLRIGSGDVLILKSKPRGSDNAAGAGFDPEVIPFLRQRDVAVLGHDASMEGGNIPEQRLPMHAFTMVALGMPLIDHMALDALSEACEKMQRWDFMFVMQPLPIENGSGSAVNPVAIF